MLYNICIYKTNISLRGTTRTLALFFCHLSLGGSRALPRLAAAGGRMVPWRISQGPSLGTWEIHGKYWRFDLLFMNILGHNCWAITGKYFGPYNNWEVLVFWELPQLWPKLYQL